MNSNVCHECKKFIQGFINDRLGDIDGFIDYDIDSLENDAIYGAGSERIFDPDNSEIMRSVYCLLWRDILTPGARCLKTACGTGKSYRGDTINSFRASFGLTEYDIKEKTQSYKYIKSLNKDVVDDELLYHRARRISDDDEFIEMVEKYFRTHCMIGNYIVLPNKPIILQGEKRTTTQTINQYRGFSSNRDYFDRFLLVLKDKLDNNKADGRWALLFNENKELFPFVNHSRFKDFSKEFLLDDADEFINGYVDDKYNVIHYSEKFPWSSRGILTKAQAIEFIEDTIKRTHSRSERMVSKLNEKLTNG